MKTKKKISLMLSMVAFIVLLFGLLLLYGAKNTPIQASASSPNKINPKANYTMTHFVNGEAESVRTGQSSVFGIYHSESKGITYASLSLLNQNYRQVDHYHDGEYGLGLAYKEISINFVAGSLNQSLTLFNGAGEIVATQINKEDINITLEEGEYSMVMTAYANPWTRKDGKKENYVLNAEFMFHIDLTAPYITGTYEEGQEKWVGIGHTVEAKDDLTWIQDFYVVQPDDKFVRYYDERSYTFQAGDTEGLYTFRAYDNTGFYSGARTVLFDGTAPSGCFYTESGELIETDGEIKQSFYFQATDELSGLSAIEYKTPTSDTWEEYTAETVIPNNAPMGKYEFRCTDVAGNESVYSINLSHDFVTEIIAPTCTAQGYTAYRCLDCGYSYTGDYVAELGHNYYDTRVDSTCTKKGYTLHECIRCNKSFQDTPVRELGHDMQPSTVLPSCTDSGYIVYSCTRCDESNRTETAHPLGHNYVTNTSAATCTEGGYTLHECARCGDNYKDDISQPLGHNFVIGTILPTCTEFGKTQYECQVCNYNYADNDGTYPTGHSYTITVIKEPTCTAEGLRRSCCDNCGHTYETAIASNGHEYEIADVESAHGKTTRTYTCKNCEEKYRQELGNQYEEVSNYVEYLFKQYEPYMWWVLLVTAGVWSIALGVMIIIAQKNEDKEKAKKMLVNYVIGLVVIAIILVACPFLMRGIATLIS